MSKIKAATQYALDIAGDDKHGYDQIKRWGDDYDCSALVITAWEQAGVPVKSQGGATYTGNMKRAFLAYGFANVTNKVNLVNGSGMEYGDVLLKEGKHTAIYIGNGKLVHASLNEKGKTTGGQLGDQTGKEICVRSYYNKPWDCVLRFQETTTTAESPVTTKEVTDALAKEVLIGKWGNGAERKSRLEQAGYNYTEVQLKVNALKTTQKTSVSGSKTHRVVLGDTLSAISKKYNTTIDKIIVDNQKRYPKIKRNFIVVGWVLTV